jgi:drug/metabolite transporter (DMT)-like permease
VKLDLALVALAALAVSVASPLAKAAEGISPIGIAAGRCGVAALVVLMIAPRATVRAIAGLSLKHKWALTGAGLLLAIHFGLFLAGLDATSLPAAVALVSLEPLAVVLAGWMAFGIRPSRMEAIGILVATAGAIVVAFGAGQGEHRLLGDLLVLGAVIFFGAYVAMARGLRDAMPVLPYAGAVYGVAFLALLPPAIKMAGGLPPPKTWWILIALGIVPTVIGHTLIQRSARRVPPSVVALVPPGETVGSIAIGAVMLGAWPQPREWVGAALILLGAVLAIRPSPPPNRARR